MRNSKGAYGSGAFNSSFALTTRIHRSLYIRARPLSTQGARAGDHHQIYSKGKPLHVFAHVAELEKGTAVAMGEGGYVFSARHVADLGKGGARKSLRLLK